jgi:hypothetical protein
MGNNIFLPEGQFPSRTEDPSLQIPLNSANFTLPAIDSLGIGNTPPGLFYGFGAFNLDWSMAKEFRMGPDGERRLEFRAEAFNLLNHFNPEDRTNANRNLNYNFTSGAQTNSAFGVITGAQVRRVGPFFPALPILTFHEGRG